ncbi:SEC14-like protein 4 [Chironomus tepperi]|uniref:SEC14-like protein 4 n=1 Tax=Chironomus tepperi TaxID=113505 RepID=UPI00391F5522
MELDLMNNFEILLQFRESVSDLLCLPEHDDIFLVRWLRARQWNLENAEKMLRDSMKFRQKHKVEELKNWDVPEVLLNAIPYGTTGCDKEGSIVIIIPFKGTDAYGLFHASSQQEVVKYILRLADDFMSKAYEQSKTYGPEARKFVVIFDMDGFTLRQYLYKPAIEAIIELIQIYTNNLPEILKFCYVINAPTIFSFFFNIVKQFLDEYTLSKINLYNSNQSKWLPAILERIDPSVLPKYYGGEMTDPDGNPKCLTKICYGGKIPKELYRTGEETTYNNASTYKTTVVKKGSKLKLSFDITESDMILKWDFTTESHDIKFGILAENLTTGEKFSEVDLKRTTSHEAEESGCISCQKNCRYTVVFDNSYSYFKSKKLTYSVVITKPLDENEVNASQIEEQVEENETNEGTNGDLDVEFSNKVSV